jgi:hypothetical protein
MTREAVRARFNAIAARAVEKEAREWQEHLWRLAGGGEEPTRRRRRRTFRAVAQRERVPRSQP